MANLNGEPRADIIRDLTDPATTVSEFRTSIINSVTQVDLNGIAVAAVGTDDRTATLTGDVTGTVTYQLDGTPAFELPTDIAEDVITTRELAADAVETVNILDANVTADKLSPGSVTTDKIVDLNVTATKLAPNVITDGIQAMNFAAVTSHLTAVPTALTTEVLMYSVHVAGGPQPIPAGLFDGQIINITSSTSGMTIDWGNGARGIGLPGSARLASGIWRAGGWYFSETVV